MKNKTIGFEVTPDQMRALHDVTARLLRKVGKFENNLEEINLLRKLQFMILIGLMKKIAQSMVAMPPKMKFKFKKEEAFAWVAAIREIDLTTLNQYNGAVTSQLLNILEPKLL